MGVNQRYIDKQGYVCIKVPGHSTAATNGWAREHRVVMSNFLGRSLEGGETVHHKDGDRLNNSPGNLELMSKAQHLRLHMGNPNNQQEGEINPVILCACGCDGSLRKYDGRGRPRKFIHGHNRSSSGRGGPSGEKQGNSKLTESAVRRIRKLYKEGKCSQVELGRTFGVSAASISHIVTRKTWDHIQ